MTENIKEICKNYLSQFKHIRTSMGEVIEYDGLDKPDPMKILFAKRVLELEEKCKWLEGAMKMFKQEKPVVLATHQEGENPI